MNAFSFHSLILHFHDSIIVASYLRSRHRIITDVSQTHNSDNTADLLEHCDTEVSHFQLQVFPSKLGGDESEPQLQRRAELLFDALDVQSDGVAGELVLDVVEQVADGVHELEWAL